ncbi:MAG: carbohydrate kinase [Devosiaceae bacterium]|nr:carbohydrate kinase [Devosiaceae bacterium MH13]
MTEPATTNITVAGEALYDVFPRPAAQGDDPSAVVLDAVTGGSPFNVACGLGRLGYGPRFFGGLANGALGDRQWSILEGAGVVMDATLRRPNLVPLMLIDLAEDGQPTYNYYGQSTADLQVVTADLESLPAAPDVLHLGSYSLAMPPIADTLAHLVASLTASSLLAIDPNVRAMVEPDVAVWRARLDPLFARADIIKLSDEDAAFLAPDQAPEAYAASLHARTGAPVFLTRGGEGVTVFAQGDVQSIAAPQVTVVDTVGAGDSFQTVLVAWASQPQRRPALADRSVTLAACVGIAETAAAVAAQICAQKGPVLPQADALAQAVSPDLFERISA